MPQTPNHGYNVPNEGATDWHIPLNENFEQYDTDIEIRDERANRNDYEPKAGAKFLATDTGEVYLGDGSLWGGVPTTGMRPRFEDVTIKRSDTPGAFPKLDFVKGSSDLGAVLELGDGSFQISAYEDTAFNPSDILSGTPEGNVGIRTSDPSVPLEIAGENNWNLNTSDGDIKIGNDTYRLAMSVALEGGGAGACNIRAKGGIERLNLGAGTNGHTLQIDEASASVNGDLDVSGSKNFVQSVDTTDGEKEVVYTAAEADTPHTETSGVSELEDGRAEIDLPDHFGWVTDGEEPLVVQTTPYGGTAGLKVAERSTDRLIVEDLAGEGEYEFSYTVRGTREGYEDKQVVREPVDTRAAGPADPSQAPADD